MKRVVTLMVLVAFVGTITGIVLAADEEKPTVWTGTVVKVVEKALTIKVKDGDKEMEKPVVTDDKTMVTLDGKEAKLADLKADMMVTVTIPAGKLLVASKVEAKTPPAKT